MIRYRLIRAGDMLTMWRTDLNGRSKLVDSMTCDHDADDDIADEAIERLTYSAEVDHGTLLPWIAVTDGSQVLMTTGLIHDRTPR